MWQSLITELKIKTTALELTGQHGAAAAGGTAQTGVFFLEFLCFARIDHQAVVVRELLSDLDVAPGGEENAVAILICFQIGVAGVIDPPGRVATVFGVDNVAIIQMEVEGVIGLVRVVWMDALGFLPGDDLALILKHSLAFLDGSNGIDTLAMDTRFAHLSTTSTGR